MLLDPLKRYDFESFEKLLESKKSFRLASRAIPKIKAAQAAVQQILRRNQAVYGINTGFGRLANVRIDSDELVDLQINILRSHASGIGEPTPPEVVRRLLLLRVLSLGKGSSGISVALIQRHLDYLNKNLIPYVPEQGSVGASGDLAPLAHLGLTFIGEGYFMGPQKNRVKAQQILKANRLRPIAIHPKEGLSLTNGTQFSLAYALFAYSQLKDLLPWIEAATCLSVEGHLATRQVYRPEIHTLKEHAEQKEVAARLYQGLAGSPAMAAHHDCERVQDAYSFRCVPQIMGPAYRLIDTAEEMLVGEINSVSDNPVYLPKTKEIASCGHFHAHAVSMACDTLSMSVATLGNLIERRIDQLVSPLTTRLTPFLARRPGVESGLMIVQTAAAALASENKALSFPASADTISTNGNQEDHVSMAPWAARKLNQAIQNLRRLVAAELLCATRACLLAKKQSRQIYSPQTESLLQELCELEPRLKNMKDVVFSELWQGLEQALR